MGATLVTAFNGGDNLSRPMMELKRNESHPDRGYVQLVDDEISFHIRSEQNRTSPRTLLTSHLRTSYLPIPVDYAYYNEDAAIPAAATAVTTVSC